MRSAECASAHAFPLPGRAAEFCLSGLEASSLAPLGSRVLSPSPRFGKAEGRPSSEGQRQG